MKYFLSIFLIIITLSFFSQKTISKGEYGIKVKDYTKGDTLYVAYYLGQKQYVKDTLVTNQQGEATFKATDLEPGLYILVFGKDKKNKYIEFLIDEPSFTLVTSPKESVINTSFFGSKQNEAFYSYLNFLNDKKEEQRKIQEDKTISKEKKEAKQEVLSEQVKIHQEKLISQFKNELLGHLVLGNMPIKPAKAPEDLTEKESDLFRYYSYKRKYFNNIDFSKSYLIYTPILEIKIETYLERLTISDPDSAIVSCDYILGLAQKNGDNFKSVLIQLVNKYAKTKKVCFDKVYVHLVENYYNTGKAPWVSEETRAKMKENAKNLSNVLCGNTFPETTLPSLLGNKVTIQNITSDYKVVVFISPSQNKSKNILKELSSLSTNEQEKDKTLKIITIQSDLSATQKQMDELKDHFKEKGYSDFINLIDKDKTYDFSSYYNLKNTPVIYLLDTDNKIMYKQITVEQVKQILSN